MIESGHCRSCFCASAGPAPTTQRGGGHNPHHRPPTLEETPVAGSSCLRTTTAQRPPSLKHAHTLTHTHPLFLALPTLPGLCEQTPALSPLFLRLASLLLLRPLLPARSSLTHHSMQATTKQAPLCRVSSSFTRCSLDKKKIEPRAMNCWYFRLYLRRIVQNHRVGQKKTSKKKKGRLQLHTAQQRASKKKERNHPISVDAAVSPCCCRSFLLFFLSLLLLLLLCRPRAIIHHLAPHRV